MLTATQVFYMSKWLSFSEVRWDYQCDSLGLTHSIVHSFSSPPGRTFKSKSRVTRRGNGIIQRTTFSKKVTAYRKAKSRGRTWPSGMLIIFLNFVSLTQIEGRVEGKWWEAEGAPDCWRWPASFFRTLWLSQRWWRRKPTKQQEWKAVKSRKAGAPQRWWWPVAICGPRGYSIGMPILIHRKLLWWRLWQDSRAMQMVASWGFVQEH